MKKLILFTALLLGLNLSAQNRKVTQLENGTIKVEQYYDNGTMQQVSYYYNNIGVGTWLKYDEQGNLIAQAKMKNGRPEILTCYEDGVITIIDRKKRSITKMKN